MSSLFFICEYFSVLTSNIYFNYVIFQFKSEYLNDWCVLCHPARTENNAGVNQIFSCDETKQKFTPATATGKRDDKSGLGIVVVVVVVVLH